MRFTKMHGIGNDYVYVDCLRQGVADPAALSRAISDRHYGVGGDGLILILPSGRADVRMQMFNADGSEGRVCGNGIRCLAKYAYDHGLSRSNPMRVETAAGVLSLELQIGADGKAASATVDMGEPNFDPRAIPVLLRLARVVEVPLRTSKHAYRMTCLSMGNPHAVIYVEDAAAVPLADVGPQIETNPLFPDRVNVHFVQVLSSQEVRMRTWERGSGATLACGTGASAVCAAGVATGRTGPRIAAHLPGGDLQLEYRADTRHVFMTGPAVEVFSGDWPK
jgi:diaminopimelate epimerase